MSFELSHAPLQGDKDDFLARASPVSGGPQYLNQEEDVSDNTCAC